MKAMERLGRSEPDPEWLLTDFPAHMHIDLLPHVQASGWGRRLIETELAALRAHDVAGVHLGVSPTNEQAIGFYRHLGSRGHQPGWESDFWGPIAIVARPYFSATAAGMALHA